LIERGYGDGVRRNVHDVEHRATLAVSDNGSGFSRDARAQGMGLRIMQYRADTIGAILTIDRAKRKGTNVLCQFKLS
jgi:nitrate/nitrite-specific signal transduction histidine kinase